MKSLIITLILLLSVVTNNQVFGQASLAAENVIEDIKVRTKHKEKVYTVFRDERVNDQWYYMPNELRVAEGVDEHGNPRPKITILRYQYKTTEGNNQEGGVLVAAFTYAIEPEVIQQVKNEIIRQKGGTNVRLSAIPFNTASIDFLSSSDKFIENTGDRISNGATSASQEMVVCFNLTVLGSSVFKALVSSAGGIPLRANITYNGLSAPCGFKINGNWENVYNFFQNDVLVEGKWKALWFTGGTNISRSEVKESLSSIKNMTISNIECPDSNNADVAVQEIMQLIQKQVFKEDVFDKVNELQRLESLLKSSDTSVAKTIERLITEAKYQLQIAVQSSVKSVDKRNTGMINYDYSKKKMIAGETTLGGVLSLKGFGINEADLIAKGYVIDIDPNGEFPSVVIGLPTINPDNDLRSVTLEVTYRSSNGRNYSESRRWRSIGNSAWQTPTNKEKEYISFNLIGEPDMNKRAEPEFDIKLQVVSNLSGGSFTINKKVKLSPGERFIDAFELLTRELTIDGSSLDFQQFSREITDLAQARISYRKGSLSINKILRPYYINGVPTPPKPIHIIIPNDDITPEFSKVTYIRADGLRITRPAALEYGDNSLENFEWKSFVRDEE